MHVIERDTAVCAGAILLAAARLLAGNWNEALPTGSWGLSFQTAGQAPVGNASAQELAKYDGAYWGDTTEPVLYLTFDAGYENGCTAKMLDVLKAHQVPAAFFLVGSYLARNPALVKRMSQEGHLMGDHTATH